MFIYQLKFSLSNLKFLVQNEAVKEMENINQDKILLKQCKYLLKLALDIDETGKRDMAIKAYMEAIEFALKVVSIYLI